MLKLLFITLAIAVLLVDAIPHRPERCYRPLDPGRCRPNSRMDVWTWNQRRRQCVKVRGCFEISFYENTFRTARACSRVCRDGRSDKWDGGVGAPHDTHGPGGH